MNGLIAEPFAPLWIVKHVATQGVKMCGTKLVKEGTTECFISLPHEMGGGGKMLGCV